MSVVFAPARAGDPFYPKIADWQRRQRADRALGVAPVPAPAAGDDARDAKLFATDELPALAGDHDSIFRLAKQRVTESLNDAFFAFRMLPEIFTIYELRRVHELFLGEMLDKRNFRKKIIALDQIEETGEKRESVRHRPARLYRVKKG